MKHKLANGCLLILGLIIFGMLTIFINSQKEVNKIEKQVTTLAREEVGLKGVDKLYIFNRDQSSYTVKGKNKDGETIYFAYQPETDEKLTEKEDKLVNEYEALSLTLNALGNVKVKEARLGIDNKQWVWEVSLYNEDGDLGYHYINAVNGHWVETVKNL